MSHSLAYVAVALLTVRWWWPTLRVLRGDLERAGGVPLPPPRSDLRHAPLPLSEDARAPLVRVLAFRGVARRVTARRRWQAGFGRRGL